VKREGSDGVVLFRAMPKKGASGKKVYLSICGEGLEEP